MIDKILTSTPSLLAIANLLLAVTYLLHSAIADLFLETTDHTEEDRGQNIGNNIDQLFYENYVINYQWKRL